MGKVNQWVMEMEECVMQSIEEHGIYVPEDLTVKYVRAAMKNHIDEKYVRSYHNRLLLENNQYMQ